MFLGSTRHHVVLLQTGNPSIHSPLPRWTPMSDPSRHQLTSFDFSCCTPLLACTDGTPDMFCFVFFFFYTLLLVSPSFFHAHFEVLLWHLIWGEPVLSLAIRRKATKRRDRRSGICHACSTYHAHAGFDPLPLPHRPRFAFRSVQVPLTLNI